MSDKPPDTGQYTIFRIDPDGSRHVVLTCDSGWMAETVADAMRQKHPDRQYVIESVT